MDDSPPPPHLPVTETHTCLWPTKPHIHNDVTKACPLPELASMTALLMAEEDTVLLRWKISSNSCSLMAGGGGSWRRCIGALQHPHFAQYLFHIICIISITDNISILIIRKRDCDGIKEWDFFWAHQTSRIFAGLHTLLKSSCTHSNHYLKTLTSVFTCFTTETLWRLLKLSVSLIWTSLTIFWGPRTIDNHQGPRSLWQYHGPVT